MAEAAKVTSLPVVVPKSKKPGLLELYRDTKEMTFSDGRREVTVLLQSPDQDTQSALLDRLFELRELADLEAKEQKLMDRIRTSAADLSRELATDLIVKIEAPWVTQQTDLAPKGDTPEGQAGAQSYWEQERRKQLSAETDADLREIWAKKNYELAARTRSVQNFTRAQICAIVLDPETLEPMLSEDRAAPNYIGRLMVKTQRALQEAVDAFLKELTDKAQREQAESAPFESSGGSPAPASDSPGATTETPPDSTTPASVSSAVASG